MAVASIVPHGKPVKDAYASSNSTFASQMQDSPLFTKSKRAGTQDRGIESQNTGKQHQNGQQQVLLQQAAPRNQTSCNNRFPAKDRAKPEPPDGFNSVIIGAAEKQGLAASQLARNGNQFASTGNYQGAVQNGAGLAVGGQGSGNGTASAQGAHVDTSGGGLATANSGRGQRYRSTNLPSGSELIQAN